MVAPAPDQLATMDRIATDLGIKRRQAWGAQPPTHAMERDWDYNAIVIHNTGHGHLETMAKIQKFDFAKRDWWDIPIITASCRKARYSRAVR